MAGALVAGARHRGLCHQSLEREHSRAKTDRLDTELLMRAFLGWLRGEKRHCSMAAIPTLEEEDARRRTASGGPCSASRRGSSTANRIKAILARFGVRSFRLSLRQAADRLESIRTAEGTPLPDNTHAELYRFLERLKLVRAQIRAIEQERLRRLAAAPAAANGPHAMVRLLARIIGSVETADMLVNEMLSRKLRDRRAVVRYAGLTGSPDESGKRRREKGLARAGNARVRRGMVQLAWRFLLFQKDSDLARSFQARTTDGRKTTRKTMIVALAPKLLIARWRFVTAGEVPGGVIVRAP
ncbi:transposase [Mesorhizobium sp. M0909]|uniref:transposase n=1 Tax=Mesorhizobium sp. M0909 TaxID=2957024 RepID=UPI0033363DD6